MSSKSLYVWDWRPGVSCQYLCQDLPMIPSHTIHYHMSYLCSKAVFSFSMEVKPEVCASSKASGPQESTGKFLVAILQDTPNTIALRNAGREVDLARMHSRHTHLSLPLMLQRELFWLVRASYGGYTVWQITSDRFCPDQCAAAATRTKRCSPGAGRRCPGEEREQRVGAFSAVTWLLKETI